VFLVPDQSPLAVQPVALVELQVNVLDWPAVIDAGEAVIETVGVGKDEPWVVALTERDWLLLFPAASTAATAYEYVVAGERPVVLLKDVPVEVKMSEPFLYILYPVTPTLSVLGLHERSIWEVETGVAWRFCGIEGAAVSPGGGGGGGGGVTPIVVAVLETDRLLSLPAASIADTA
jgi:hypothetical protein